MAADSSQNPALRRDARLNRDRILVAARQAFTDRGLDVPMAAIARRAGVGVATLYRRFPTRDALITEVFTDQLGECAAVIDEALTDPDGWRAFATVLETVCHLQIADRGFAEAFLTAFPTAVDFEATRGR
ncbi:MAG: TetR/AcrR family transcriptional regulator, partial [Stackebrandtia sp.]